LQKYGTEPSVTYFNSPVIVDNLLGKIVKDFINEDSYGD